MDGEVDFVDGDVFDFLKLVFQNTAAMSARSRSWLKLIDGARRLVALASRGNDMLAGALERRAPLRPVAASSTAVPRRGHAVFLRLFPGAGARRWRRRSSPRSGTSPPRWCSSRRHEGARHRLRLGRHGALSRRAICEAEVTGVTLSDEQFAIANRRAVDERPRRRSSSSCRTTATLERTFDRIVSVGMFEHVGVENYAEFFHKSPSCCPTDGVMLLHTIGRTDGRRRDQRLHPASTSSPAAISRPCRK